MHGWHGWRGGGQSPRVGQARPAPRKRKGGFSVGEGAWALVPLPSSHILQVIVPYLGKDFSQERSIHPWKDLQHAAQEDGARVILKGRKSTGQDKSARKLTIYSPRGRATVKKWFQKVLELAEEAGLDMLSFSLPKEFRGDPSEDEPSMPVPPQVYYDEKGPVPEPEDDEPENDVDWNRSPSPDRSAQSALETGPASSSFVEHRVQQWQSLGGAQGVPIPGTHRGLGALPAPTPSQEDSGKAARSQEDAGGESSQEDAVQFKSIKNRKTKLTTIKKAIATIKKHQQT